MNQYQESDSLQHYGVKGMRWGVRRASKKLSSATTSEERKKAVSTLQKHRSKGAAQIAKLQKRQPKLEKAAEQAVLRSDVKAAEYRRRAANSRIRAGSRFASSYKRERAINNALKWESRAYLLESKSTEAKAKIKANKAMQEAFQREITNIDQILVERGKKYLKGA